MSKSKGRKLAEWLRNLDSNSKASSNTLADDSVTAAKIADDAVTNPKIVDGAIHTANLADANVTFAKLHTDVTITSSTGISGSNDNDTTVPTTAALIDYIGAQIQTKDNSDEITEGSTNLYFTNARVASYLSTNGYGTSSTIIASITDSAPTTLNTLNELAAALGDDANFSTTVTNSIGTKWTQDNTKISNWDTAYGWGNHASAGYLTSFDITTQTDSKYLRSDVNDQMLAQLYGGFGAVTTAGTTDWNHSTNARSGGGYTLLLGSASNGPGGNVYYHPFSFEYSSKNGNGNMTQLAIPYNGSTIWHRYRYSSSWSSWVQEWNSGNDGSGSGLDADTLDGVQGSGYQTRLLQQSSRNIVLRTGATGSAGLFVEGSNDTFRIQIYGTGTDYGFLASEWGGWDIRKTPGGNLTLNNSTANIVYHAGNDGSGSGLDADTVDGIQASGFMQLGTSSTSTVTQVFSAAAAQPMLWRDTNATNATNCNIYSYWYAQGSTLGYIGYGSSSNNYLYLSNGGHGGIYLNSTSSTNTVINGNVAWHAGNDGAGSGLDADTVDGIEASGLLQVAGNQNITGHKEFQNDVELRFGNSANVRMEYRATGDFYCRSYSHGARLLFQGENSSGSNKALVYMDPDDATSLYHAGVQKGYTYSSGWRVTGNVLATSDVYAYYSDERLKTKQGKIESAIDKVNSIETFYYTHNDLAKEHGFEEEKMHVGVSAQTVEKVMPEVVALAPFDNDGSGGSISGENYKTVQYEKLVPLLIEAIKEQQVQIEELKEIIKCQ